jgi:hypothetical protein
VDFDVGIVQAEGELIHLTGDVPGAGVMVDTVHPALHYRPDRLHAVYLTPSTLGSSDRFDPQLKSYEVALASLSDRLRQADLPRMVQSNRLRRLAE